MQALELEIDIDENHEIHLKLPDNVRARKAKVLVLYDEPSLVQPQDRQPREFGQFRDKVRMSDDFDAPLSEDLWLGGNP